MKKTINILSLIILSVFSNTAFSSSWELNYSWSLVLNSAEEITSTWTETINNKDDIKTIKELKEEVKTIDEQKEISDKNLDTLKKEILISRFFKTDLNETEKIELNILVQEYKKTKEGLNKQLSNQSQNLENTQETIKQLLENEKEIYKKLLSYIKIEKYEEYKEFIKQDIILINTNSTLESSIIKKETIIQNKVDDLKEKIKEHHNILNEKLINLVNIKIDEKLNELTQKEKFKILDQKSKIRLFEKLIDWIEIKSNTLKEKENKTRLLVKKIELYQVIIDRINIFKNNLLNFVSE